MKPILISLFVFTFTLPLYAFESSVPVLAKSSYAGFPNTLNGHDFFILKSKTTKLPKNKMLSLPSFDNCRDQIAKVVCLVDPMKEGEDLKNRRCLEGGQSYAIYFEELYDNYPSALQKMFCSVRHIYIEKQFAGTAYASAMQDASGKVDGALIGIRQSVLDQSLNLATWASWKEQLSFGGVVGSYTVSPDLPQIVTTSQTQANDFLYFVITHEFGHLFDFANQLNKQINCPEPAPGDDEYPECDMAEGSWGAISWLTDKKPKPSNEFVNRTGLCFYFCDGKTLSKADVPMLYETFINTDFISLYATQHPWDDLAESLAYYMMDQKLNSLYIINSMQGKSYDTIARIKNPIFATKVEYLKNFLNKPNIIYP